MVTASNAKGLEATACKPKGCRINRDTDTQCNLWLTVECSSVWRWPLVSGLLWYVNRLRNKMLNFVSCYGSGPGTELEGGHLLCIIRQSTPIL